MRLSLRFVVPLLLVLGLLAYGIVPLVDKLTLRWFVRDLDIRSTTIAATLQEPVAEALAGKTRAKLTAMLARVSQDERLLAIGLCDANNNLLYRTPVFPGSLSCIAGTPESGEAPHLVRLPEGLLHVARAPVSDQGTLILVHDMSFIERRSADTKKYLVALFAILGLVVSIVTVIVAQLSLRGWVSGIRSMIKGELPVRSLIGATGSASVERITQYRPELIPLARDLRGLVRELRAERYARDESQISWTPETLRGILHNQLLGDQVLVVSNREPYIHARRDGAIEIQRPASGLVTALEPVMRACSGTWIAHGSGSADREVVDRRGRIPVPPANPAYQLRRIWLSADEESGYYYGFANEGLWPLCHIAHTRPTFRSSDWQAYQAINRRFAEAVEAEANTSDPVVLIQDYHLALVPRMVRERLPNATIITFWHIPWPNPETFGICPWREELLHGMLGSSILGFHTQFHCNNFFDTVDRYLETRLDRELFTISYGRQLTAVKPYPISIEWPGQQSNDPKEFEALKEKIAAENGIPPECTIGVGVDRMDYTKGILERFLAVERFLELRPDWLGRFAFVQIAAPTRSRIEEYQSFETQVRALAVRINKRFGRDGYEPIVLRIAHHDAEEVRRYYCAAELCYVSSLHDGMNLVAKEYIAARADEGGMLVLSQFTGAAREFPEAIIVNPYHIDQCAAALDYALTMTPLERRQRMRSMRAQVREYNVYRWAGRMLMDAARMRQQGRVAPVTLEVPG